MIIDVILDLVIPNNCLYATDTNGIYDIILNSIRCHIMTKKTQLQAGFRYIEKQDLKIYRSIPFFIFNARRQTHFIQQANERLRR